MVHRFPLLIPLAVLLLLAGLAVACKTTRPLVNLALRRPAYHSSAIDYNATAQLAVDGIVETQPPCWVEICGNGGVPLSKIEHNLVLDPRQWTAVTMEGSTAELSLRTHGFTEPVDRISMTLAAVLPERVRNVGYVAELQQLGPDGAWISVKRFKGQYTGRQLTLSWDAPQRQAAEGWRFVVDAPGASAIQWQMWQFYRDGQLLPMLTSEHFSSVWVPATGGREWLAVDLGESCSFSEVRLQWLNGPARGVVQVSPDSVAWRDVAEIGGAAGAARSDTLRVHARGRWVRLLLEASVDGNPYVLTEMEVIGQAPAGKASHSPIVFVPIAKDQKAWLNEGWELARLPQAGDSIAWIPATVPGTVLVSYLDNGMLPDPNYSDNQLYISDSYFLSPFVYRCRFLPPNGWRRGAAGDRVRLHFDGINWKADVSLNGVTVGRIEGAYTDASFDVTDLLTDENLLEVTVYPPAHPGATKENTQARCATNGGVLGADNPTFHASVGWDWIPTIRGRNMGIWNDVWLERHGPVRILHPNATARFTALETLPPQFDTTQAFITLSATLVNDSPAPVKTVWEGSYGDVPFRETVSLEAGETRAVSTHLVLEQPKLWWPNGYGEPYLYNVEMRAGDSQSVRFQSGVRQFTYDASGNNLRIWINGRRFVGRGGNWGFSESNLRMIDYETAMRLHRHENFNLVRNWVGMIGDAEFYEAADRNGICVWQDFWLANPADGPDPDDEALFMDNAENMLLRVRTHPCLLLWCGRNEGYPPATLDKALRELVRQNNPESYYISSSADGEVSGRGPYYRLPSKDYWQLDQIPWYRNESAQFHSERGMPNFPNYESLLQMMPASQAWPPSRMWGIHDFALESAQRGQTFIDAVNAYFGPSPDGETFAARAQWVNYDGYRAMFESRSKQRRGLLLWMSHPAWPSMAFCTYDWYFDCTASYYACRKACEPLHIQWNPATEQVEVVNYYAGNHTSLHAVAQVYDLFGTLVSTQDATLDSPEDSTTSPFGTNFSPAGILPDSGSTADRKLGSGNDADGKPGSGNDADGKQGSGNVADGKPDSGSTASSVSSGENTAGSSSASSGNTFYGVSDRGNHAGVTPDACLLRLLLYKGDKLLSQNDYFIPQDTDNLQILNTLPSARVRVNVQTSGATGTVTLKNDSDVPALMLHLVARQSDGFRILPTYFSDNYLHLLPGETRTISFVLPEGINLGKIELNGFNLER